MIIVKNRLQKAKYIKRWRGKNGQYEYLYKQPSEKVKREEPKKRLAPNGKPSKLNEFQYKQVRTPEFKDWFGDWENSSEGASKVVDENGEPLVVYHGTNTVFDEFSKKTLGTKTKAKSAKDAFFFTTSHDTAEHYMRENIESLNKKDKKIYEDTADSIIKEAIDLSKRGNTIAGTAFADGEYINRDNVNRFIERYDPYFDISNLSDDEIIIEMARRAAISHANYPYKIMEAYATEKATHYGEIVATAKIGLAPQLLPVYLNIKKMDIHDQRGFRLQKGDVSNQTKQAFKTKKDGGLIKNIIDGGEKSNHYYLFNPNDIKSAIGNKGTFDKNNPSIRKSRIIVKSINLNGSVECQKLAKKHNVSVEHIKSQLDIGKKEEMEHTDRQFEARKIALDHLESNPNYYSKLKASGLADELEKALKTPAQKKFDLVMHEFEVGALEDSHGNLVTDKDQALAIAYSESGMSKSRVIVKSILRKAKYLKRWKVKGKWQYKYVDDRKRAKLTEPVIPANQFNAESYFVKTDDPNATIESVLKNISPEIKAKIKETEVRIKGITPTIDKYRISGEGASAIYDKVRTKKHEEIIFKMLSPERIINASPGEGKQPVVTMLAGRGGSGKSWFEGKVYDSKKAIVLDSDEIKKQLAEYEGWNAFEVHEESSDILEKAMAMAKAYKLNIVIDATMKTTSSAIDKVVSFKKAGYDIKAHYMHCPRQISAQRAVKRFAGPTGRYVPVGVVLSNVSNEKTFDAVKQYASTWSFMDSSGDPPPHMISKKNGVYSMAKAIEDKESTGEKVNPDAYDMYDFGPVIDEKDYSQDLKDMIERNRPEKMIKSKYTKRYKGKDGKWRYEYGKQSGYKKGTKLLIDMGKGPEKVTFVESFTRGPENMKFVCVLRHQTGYPNQVYTVEASVFKNAIVDPDKPVVIIRNLMRKARTHKITTMAKLKTIASPAAEYDHSYKLQGRMNWHGLQIGIENKKGSYRRGKDADGKPWETYMNFDYGRIGGSKAVDNEGVDIYIGPDDTAERVYVVHQQDPFKKCYDEDKVMCNFPSKESAIESYLSQYDRPDFLGPVSEFTIPEFKTALKERRGTMLYNSPNQFKKSQIIIRDMRKAKKMAIGTVSHGRKKIAEGKWVPVKSDKPKQTTKVYSNAQMKTEMLKLDKKHKEDGFIISANHMKETMLNSEQSRKYNKYTEKGSHPHIRMLMKQGRGNDWAKILTLDAYLVFGDNLNVRIPKNEWKDFGIGNMDNLKKSRIVVRNMRKAK